MGPPSLAGEGRDKNSRSGGSECWGVPVSGTETESSGRSLTSNQCPGPEAAQPRPVPPAAETMVAGGSDVEVLGP